MSEQMSEGKDAETKPTETKPTEATVHPEDRLDAVKQAIRAQCEIEQKLNSTQHGPLYLWDFDDIARAAIAALSHSPRPAGTVEVMAEADKVITIYDAVHGELEQNGDDWSKIDLVKHGFNEAARRMSYANWRGYMTGAIYHALKAVALFHRQRALTPQTTGEKDKL